jgi:thiol-disulfide isomerase/thioredoxin
MIITTKMTNSEIIVADSQHGGKVREVAEMAKKEKIPVIIFIHANWCGHCHTTRPEWDKFITRIKSSPPRHKSAAIAVEESDLDELESVFSPQLRGFPTILFTDHSSGSNKFEEFSMPRTADNIMKFFLDHVANMSTTIVPKVEKSHHIIESHSD